MKLSDIQTVEEAPKLKLSDITGDQQPDSIMKNMSQGQNPIEATKNYIGEHPVKSLLLEPARQSYSGESTQQFNDRTVPDYSNRFGDPSKKMPIINEATKAGITVDEFSRRMGQEAVDMAGNPGAYIGGKLLKAGATGAKLVEKAIPETLKKSSYGLMNSIIRQLPKEFRYGQNAGRGAVKEGITGHSAEDIAQKADEKIKAIGGEGNALVSNVNTTDNYEKSIKVIDDKISELSKNAPRENKTTIERLSNAKKDLLGVVEDQQGNTVSQTDLSNMTPREALDFKRKYEYVTQWKGIASDDAVVNSTLQKSRRVLKDQLNNNVPGLKQWNDRYGDLATLKTAAQRKAVYDQAGNGISKMLDGAFRKTGGIAAVGALATGHVDAAMEILGGMAAKEVMGSPTIKSNLAQFLYKLSEPEKSKLFKTVPWIRMQYKNIMTSMDKNSMINNNRGSVNASNFDEGQNVIIRSDKPGYNLKEGKFVKHLSNGDVIVSFNGKNMKFSRGEVDFNNPKKN